MPDTFTRLDSLLAIVLLVSLGITGVYDLVALGSGGTLPTVSARLQSWSRAYPLLPFAVGLLVGHLFFPPRPFDGKLP